MSVRLSVSLSLQLTCYIAGVATWRIERHDTTATCHIAGCCHLANSMACRPGATCHSAKTD